MRRLVSVEQVFAEPVSQYYGHLNALGDRYPHTPPDMTGWCEWFLARLTAHMERTLRLNGAFSSWMSAVEQDLSEKGLPLRLVWASIHVNLFEEVSARQYEQAAVVKRATAVSDLNLGVAAGLLTRVGSGPATRYRLPDNVTAFRISDFPLGSVPAFPIREEPGEYPSPANEG